MGCRGINPLDKRPADADTRSCDFSSSGGHMRRLGAFVVAVSLAATTLVAQSPASLPGAKYGADPNYQVPRTPDGRPDLQGVWANNNVTPMTRPTQWANKEQITPAELEELKR